MPVEVAVCDACGAVFSGTDGYGGWHRNNEGVWIHYCCCFNSDPDKPKSIGGLKWIERRSPPPRKPDQLRRDLVQLLGHKEI